MQTNIHVFDLDEGERLKEQGMSYAASTRAEILEHSRAIARDIGSMGEVDIDKVYYVLNRQGHDINLLGSAAGSIFKGKQWEFTGEWRKSTRTSNHARMVRVWRLKK